MYSERGIKKILTCTAACFSIPVSETKLIKTKPKFSHSLTFKNVNIFGKYCVTMIFARPYLHETKTCFHLITGILHQSKALWDTAEATNG